MFRPSPLRSFGLRALLPLAVLAGAPTLALAGVSACPPALVAQDDFEAIMGGELIVDGARFRAPEIKRALVTGKVGGTAIENRKLRLLILQEVAQRIEAGADPKDFLVTKEELKSAVEEQEQALKEGFPDGEYTVENMMEGGLDAFKSQVELTRMFNRTFIPTGDPSSFPPVTLVALKQSEIGSAVFEQLKQDWEVDKLRVTPAPKNPLLNSILYQEIYDYLLKSSTVLEGKEVPDNVIVRINGDDITVEDIWNDVKGQVSSEDVLKAKKWLTNTHLLRKALADVWPSDEEAQKLYDEYAAPFDASMIPMKNFALGIKGFPNMLSFVEFRRIYDAFKKRIQPEITPESLKKFAELRTQRLIGGSTVDVDVILLSAYDFKNKKWKKNGWADAESRAREVVKKLQEKHDWDDLLDEYSEFYDEPGQTATAVLTYKGRFRNLGRNDLMRKLGESEYLMFLNGGSLADFIFFTVDAGSVGGVKKGPYGWYIPLVRKRNDKPLQTNEAQLIEMAEQDFMTVRLGLYVSELYKNAKIEGLRP